jgi:hypothetical protein
MVRAVARTPPPKARMIGARYDVGLKAERSRIMGTPLDLSHRDATFCCGRQTAGLGRGTAIPLQAGRRIATPGLGWGLDPRTGCRIGNP